MKRDNLCILIIILFVIFSVGYYAINHEQTGSMTVGITNAYKANEYDENLNVETTAEGINYNVNLELLLDRMLINIGSVKDESI